MCMNMQASDYSLLPNIESSVQSPSRASHRANIGAFVSQQHGDSKVKTELLRPWSASTHSLFVPMLCRQLHNSKTTHELQAVSLKPVMVCLIPEGFLLTGGS